MLDLVDTQLERALDLLGDFLKPQPAATDAACLTDVSSLCAEVRGLAFGEAATHGVELSIDVEEGLLPIAIVRGDGEAVLLDLIRNGIRAISGEGTISVRAESCAMADGTPGISISVADSGPGIPESMLAGIFELGRGGSGKGGHGLGLAFCSLRARRCGGELAVETTDGMGTTFVLRLPAARPELP
jgi:signal transduction histidine kinase